MGEAGHGKDLGITTKGNGGNGRSDEKDETSKK